MPEPQAQLIELFHQHAALSIEELWLRCFALGGMNTPMQLEGFLQGALQPAEHEHNLMALALNQYFTEIDLKQSVPYFGDELAT